jgi:hypothetical protein
MTAVLVDIVGARTWRAIRKKSINLDTFGALGIPVKSIRVGVVLRICQVVGTIYLV